MARFKLKKARKADPNELSPKVQFEPANIDFIPYSGYYNKNTIITKNGELMKVIRVTGFNYEKLSSDEEVNLRETVRDAIYDHIKSDDFALWISTIRRKKEIKAEGKFDDLFSKRLDKEWSTQNKWENQYVNELYITIIIEGYNTSIINLNSLFRSFSFGSTKKLHSTKLKASHKKLDRTVNNMMKSLDAYGATILGVHEFQGEIYSQPMRFFGKLVNLCEDRYPLTPTDMSEELTANYQMAIGNNSLAVGSKNKKHYAAMFSIKEYQEIAIDSLDELLQLPQEFIITQSVDFINRNEALAQLDYQNYVLDVSHDEQIKELSGLDNIISSDSGSLTDFGKQQITLMLINENSKELSNDIENILEKVDDLGLVTVREDVFSELCFWSQLPGNFRFLRRQKPINIYSLGGFASSHNLPAGNKSGNHWGDAVTIFRTIVGTPYFFNFHKGDNGHTILVGPDNSGKTTLLNFLIAQSRKFNSKIYYFGANHSGKIFINAIGGNYLSLNDGLDDANALTMRPLSLKKTKENADFLKDWFFYLVNYGKNKIDEKELDLIPKIVDKIIKKDVKTLADAAKLFKTKATANIYKKLLPWHSKGKYSFIFDGKEEIAFDENLITAFDLTKILGKKALVVPTISYILRKIENRLDGSPAILVLDEAWELLDNYALGPKINEFLKRLRQKNCIVVLATKSATDAAMSNITKSFKEELATEIFLPDSNPTDYYKTIFGLTEEEFDIISQMDINQRHLMLKHGDDSVIASLDLSSLPHLTTILSSNNDSLEAMDDVKKQSGHDFKKWLPEFMKLIDRVLESQKNN